MKDLHFNGLFKPYLQALKIKEIYKYQFKYNNWSWKIAYLISFLTFIISTALLVKASLKTFLLYGGIYFFSALVFFFLIESC